MRPWHILFLATFAVLLVFSLTWLWEFTLEDLLLREIGAEEESAEEHWKFVLTATFAAATMVIILTPVALWTALGRRRAQQALHQQLRSADLLRRIAIAANASSDTSQVMQVCLDEICAYTGWPVGHAFHLAEDGTGDLVSTGLWHLDEREGFEEFVRATGAAQFAPDIGLIGRVLAQGKPHWMVDINQEPGYARARPGRDLPVRAAFAFPILTGTRVVAVLEFCNVHALERDEQLLDVVTQLGTLLGRTAERALAAEALSEREEFIRLITDNIPFIILYADRTERLRFINRVGEVWHRRPQDDLIGREIKETIDSAAYESLRPHLDGVLAGEPQYFDQAMTYADGMKRDLVVAYVPHIATEGQVVGFFGVVQDITKRKNLERRLSQAQKMEAIGQLTGGIAHDFNNLLMIIDGYAQRAMRNLDDKDAAQGALNEVVNGAQRAAKLTKQLLSFSRRQVLEKRVFRVEEEISETQDMLQRSAGERYPLRFENEAAGTCVETDPGEFGQALINLTINARDSMPKGGPITIGTRVVELEDDCTMNHQDMKPGRFVEIYVKDQGHGIGPETLPRIFEPFFTTKEQGRGTGLGLAMVIGFAQQSGGTVDVESTLNEGTTFKIYLPMVDLDPEALAEEVEEEHRGKGETILLVEDEAQLLDLVRGTLEALGYEILAAADGFEALEIESEYDSRIDLLLSDVVMPSMSGFEVCEIIREQRPEMKVVLMSGYPDRGQTQFEKIPDYARFLQKPVKPGRLAQAIRDELDSQDLQVAG